MQNILSLNPESSFKNPFDENNANSIDSHKLLELWCDPFSVDCIKDIDFNTFAHSKDTIILQGSRGSGKTTILKYFSYPLLMERARMNQRSLVDEIEFEKSVGFYFRFDDSFINTFQSVFKNCGRDNWVDVFDSYFELVVCSQIIILIGALFNDLEDSEKKEKLFCSLFQEKTDVEQFKTVNTIKQINDLLSEGIKQINHFKNNGIFSDAVFCPSYHANLFSLSVALICSLQRVVSKLESTTFLLLVDEYEVLTHELQCFFNTKIKFSNQNLIFRIGRRSEGLITTKTLNNEEYLRKDHDFKLAVIRKNLNMSRQYEKFFIDMANKRLKTSNLNVAGGIIKLLGKNERLDEECLAVCKKRDKHLHEILSQREDLKNDLDLRNNIISIIRNEENPIAESINALWVIRGGKNPIDDAISARDAMNSFFKREETRDEIKYKNDYVNKYRYAITVLLASVYRDHKKYYGFSSILKIADGNARFFINVCRYVFNDAFFYERESFLTDQIISVESQNRAIHDFSLSEFKEICSIIEHGKEIECLINNIGNVFRDYHKDLQVRYPETNQFSFDDETLDEKTAKVIETAISWSMICKKDNLQRISVSKKQVGEICYLNRAFAPIFDISLRTRGGFNVQFSKEEMEEMVSRPTDISKLKKQIKKKIVKKNQENDEQQPRLF